MTDTFRFTGRVVSVAEDGSAISEVTLQPSSNIYGWRELRDNVGAEVDVVLTVIQPLAPEPEPAVEAVPVSLPPAPAPLKPAKKGKR